MEQNDLSPDLSETDDLLRSIIAGAVDEAPPEHLRQIRVALAAEAAPAKPPGFADVWLPAGILGVLAVVVLGTTEPLLAGATFAIALVWTLLLARIDQPSMRDPSGA